MGFDKPDLGFVVHLGAPASPVAYYQQIGRAGRAVERAEVVLLPGHEDRDIWAYFASLAFPPEPLVRQTLRVLDAPERAAVHGGHRDAGRPVAHPAGDAAQGAGRDGAVRRVKGGWIGTGAEWVYDERAPPAHRRGAQGRAAGDARLPRHHRVPAGVPAPPARRPGAIRTPCGRCDNCTGTAWNTRGRCGAAAGRGRAAGPARGRGARRASSGPAGMAELGRAGVRADHGRRAGRRRAG